MELFIELYRRADMSNTNDLLNRINSKYSKMSKGQKIIATYITDNYDKAVFLTAAKMGETVGVSESTVVRFATSLGYKGYPEFQEALEELVRNKLNSLQRMEVTYGRITQSEILQTVLQSDADKIKTTLEKIDHSAFEMAVSTIAKAKNIYIVGIRSCAPLANFLGFYLNLMFDNVHLLTTNSSSELFEQSKKRIHRIGQNKPCFYYQLKCGVEYRIYETLEMRKDFTDKLFEEEDNNG